MKELRYVTTVAMYHVTSTSTCNCQLIASHSPIFLFSPTNQSAPLKDLKSLLIPTYIRSYTTIPTKRAHTRAADDLIKDEGVAPKNMCVPKKCISATEIRTERNMFFKNIRTSMFLCLRQLISFKSHHVNLTRRNSKPLVNKKQRRRRGN